MAVPAQVCDRISVMRLGEIVEIRPDRRSAEPAGAPYTQALLAAIPGGQRKALTISPDALRGGVRH